MSVTATVTFTGTWFTDPATPSISVHGFKVARAEQATLDGSVRVYAGGRRRIITTPLDSRSSQIVLQRVTAADVETLRAWRGRALLMRDFQGWRRWGTFFDLQATSVYQGPAAPTYIVQLTWLDIDYAEGV